MRERYTLHIVVFVASFAVMALEVIGLGILAPYFGTALIVQTNLIAVVLMCLSIGYRLGGILADRGATKKHVSHALAVAGALIILLLPFRDPILVAVVHITQSVLIGSFLASLLLIGCVSVCLGTILPYAIKLHVQTVLSSGTSSGILYALSALGSIGGTFVTAFYILPFFGHSGSLFFTFSLLLLSFFILTSFTRPLHVGTAFVLSYILFFHLPLPQYAFRQGEVMNDSRFKSDTSGWKKLADESGVFSRIQVFEGKELETNRSIRLMAVNGEVHSGGYMDSNELLFNYARFNRLGGHFNPAAKKALLIGGGSYSYANYFLTDTPLYDIEKVWELAGRHYHNNKTVSLPVLFTNNLAKRSEERTLVYTSPHPRTKGEEEGLHNHIEADNQAPSTTVTVKRADILNTGFDTPRGYVHIHETKHDGTPGRVISADIPLEDYLHRPRTIIGKGELITGENTDVHVTLDRPAKEGEVLYAMLHRDNGNGHFDDFLVDGYEQIEALDVVEIDPRTTRLAEKYFGLNQRDPRLRIFHEDARVYLNRTEDTYDIIYMDAFRSFFAVPWQLATREATQRVYDMLNPNGVLVANVPASLEGAYSRFFQTEYQTYTSVFDTVHVYASISPQNETMVQNIILVAFKSPETVRETLSDDSEINKQLAHRWFGKVSATTSILTDDLAPTDNYTNSFAEFRFF